jgi:transcription initiation factor TFIIIB Brf1 subunit/transcription initiation factor TFIIB
MTSPSEGMPRPEARPLPCPECGSTKGYSRMGDFRVQCLNCNSLIKNEEVDMQLPIDKKEQ